MYLFFIVITIVIDVTIHNMSIDARAVVSFFMIYEQ
jgi:hypothetical protein